jgi:hypothetical protein
LEPTRIRTYAGLIDACQSTKQSHYTEIETREEYPLKLPNHRLALHVFADGTAAFVLGEDIIRELLKRHYINLHFKHLIVEEASRLHFLQELFIGRHTVEIYTNLLGIIEYGHEVPAEALRVFDPSTWECPTTYGLYRRKDCSRLKIGTSRTFPDKAFREGEGTSQHIFNSGGGRVLQPQ